jgi:hypothetical protein
MTENDPHPKRVSTRTERARSGRWAIGRIGGNHYRVINRSAEPSSRAQAEGRSRRSLDNGGHAYTVTHDSQEWACDCQDYTQRRGRCKHIEAVRLSLEGERLQVQPLITSDEAGIHATFLNGADLSLTVGGRTACSRCGPSACEHVQAALPHYTRWLWAQAIEGRWPAPRIAQLGIPPAAA